MLLCSVPVTVPGSVTAVKVNEEEIGLLIYYVITDKGRQLFISCRTVRNADELFRYSLCNRIPVTVRAKLCFGISFSYTAENSGKLRPQGIGEK